MRKHFLVGLWVVLALAGCSKKQAVAPARPAIPVVVAKAIQKSMPVQVTAVGNVETISTVAIKAQVAGVLQEVHFKEGDFVRQGQVLFTIDPRPYQAALDQAMATLNRDKAVAANNRLQADRYAKLRSEGVVSASDADTYRSTADASEALVGADEAAIKTAQLNLEYCTLSAPISGQTGAVAIKAGNVIKVADLPIVVINQVDPIYVNFTVPQQYWKDIKEREAQGKLPVSASVPQNAGPAVQGLLAFVDNAVDANTGTIHLRASFSNAQRRLWPGLYVTVVLVLSQQQNAIVVPEHAITAGQEGSVVYVVKPGNTVERRLVSADRTVGGNTVISKGLESGETVVVDGLVNLTPGARVQIKNLPVDANVPSDSVAPPKAD